MAASIARRLFTSANRLCYRHFLRIRQSGTREQLNQYRTLGLIKLCKRYQFRTAATVGTSVGLSLEFFGLSFGKKEENDDLLTETYRGARLAHMRNDLQKADELYHEALKLADDLLKAKKITEEKHVTARTLMYDGLADIAMKAGNLEVAEKLFVETIRGCISQGMSTDHNAIVEISVKLASMFAMQGKKIEAEEGYKYCLQQQNSKMEELEKKWKEQVEKKNKKSATPSPELTEIESDNAGLMGIVLGSYGRFLLYEKRYEEALPLFQRAELIAKNVLGENSDQYIVVLNDLATLYIVTKNFDQAQQALENGIKISEQAQLKEGAMMYCNLGAVHLRKGDTEQAMKICQKGLECAQKVDHKLAYKMADSCIRKCKNVLKEKQSKSSS